MSERRRKQVERIMANFNQQLDLNKKTKSPQVGWFQLISLQIGTTMKLVTVILKQLNEIEGKLEDIA